MKGTYAMGKKRRRKKTIHCRRCGRRSYHITKHACSYCGYGKSAKIKKFRWQKKKVGKMTNRQRHLHNAL